MPHATREWRFRARIISACIALAALTALWLAAQQRPVITGTVEKSGQHLPVIAVPDFRGAGDASPLMTTFNNTLWSDLENSGSVKLVAKTFYPTVTPQQPSDILDPRPDVPKAGGRLMSDWSNPPAQANYLAFGYAAAKEGLFVAFCYFFDLSQPTSREAKVIGELYTGSLDEDGARKAAHDFAAAILKRFGGTPLFGTHIYFASKRGKHKEIWVMDYDGSNQQQITHFNTSVGATSPAVSPDGSRLMCTAYAAEDKPARLFLYSTDTFRRLDFVNPPGSYAAHASFSADGRQVLFDVSGSEYRIYIAGLDGSNAKAINSSQSLQVQPVMNPKNPNLIAFTSGRSGTPQIYTMNADGGDVTRITNGIGEAYNPAWAPDGSHLAFAWTQGYEPGSLNIFILNAADHSYVQLTHGEGKGKNEHPAWAPDGIHIAFDSTRSGAEQIWSMLADGSGLRQLTTEGVNTIPAWSK
jgi:TolB protein